MKICLAFLLNVGILASTGSTVSIIFKDAEVRRLKSSERHNAPEPLGIPPDVD
jgi:hypothetical protein